MTAPSFINGEWVIPDNINETECPEVILLKRFEIEQRALAPEPEPTQVHVEQDFSPAEQTKPEPKQYVYTGPPHPLAQKGLEKLLHPPPDCESQLIQPKKLHLKRYSDSSFYTTSRNVYPTIDDQKQLCKLISKSLFSDENRANDARGIEMFQEKLSKIEEFSLESEGSKMERNALEDYLDGRSAAQPCPADPIKTFLADNSFQEDQSLLYTSNEFRHFHEEEHSKHEGITPDQAFGLIQGLKNDTNRGAEIFEKRRQNADKWVVDETNVKKAPPRAVSPTVMAKMAKDLNKPLQEDYAATIPSVQTTTTKLVTPKVDLSIDMTKIQDPIEILELALQDKAPEPIAVVVPAPAAVTVAEAVVAAAAVPAAVPAAPESVAAPAPPAPVEVPAPAEPVAAPQPAQALVVPTPAAAPFLPKTSTADLQPFLGQGPSGWKSIKPPGMKS